MEAQFVKTQTQPILFGGMTITKALDEPFSADLTEYLGEVKEYTVSASTSPSVADLLSEKFQGQIIDLWGYSQALTVESSVAGTIHKDWMTIVSGSGLMPHSQETAVCYDM